MIVHASANVHRLGGLERITEVGQR
jgi:hypothetical protein